MASISGFRKESRRVAGSFRAGLWKTHALRGLPTAPVQTVPDAAALCGHLMSLSKAGQLEGSLRVLSCGRAEPSCLKRVTEAQLLFNPPALRGSCTPSRNVPPPSAAAIVAHVSQRTYNVPLFLQRPPWFMYHRGHKMCPRPPKPVMWSTRLLVSPPPQP